MNKYNIYIYLYNVHNYRLFYLPYTTIKHLTEIYIIIIHIVRLNTEIINDIANLILYNNTIKSLNIKKDSMIVSFCSISINYLFLKFDYII